MEVAVIGINHNIAPIEVREKVHFSQSKKSEAISSLKEMGIDEVVILSTCNRSEIFIVSSDIDNAITMTKDFYISFFDDTTIEKYIFSKNRNDAVLHIFEVCCGLDSLVIGEDQILGQVKDAIETAIELKGSSKVLNKLFRKAITLSKKIKSKTKLSEKPLSISYLGVKKLKENIDDFSDKKVLCVGLGKMGMLALTHLREYEINKVYISNRNILKSMEISEQIKDVEIVKYEELKDIINEVDILICTTSSPHRIINEKDIDINRVKPLYILDLALPRDVDENVKNNKNVFLYSIDSLKVESEENQKLRKELLIDNMDVINESISEFNSWKLNMKIDPVLESINKKSQYIKEDTLSYIYRKTNLNNREKKIIDKMIESSMKRLLREPILNLKCTREEEKLAEYSDVLKELFGF
ncbi:glutamyl-tRNA reductase [Tissierella creatinini]|nr:glutamyl-tRNA reductase [Tissierella creatinini]TJX63821.1 glutamyl-tRNA reductase [Soehngenia saccharolytica]